MKRGFLVFGCMLLLFSCGISSKKSPPIPEVITPKSEIVRGVATLKSISPLKTDTTILSIEYAFFSKDGEKLEAYQDSINSRIVNFVQANTEFEKGKDSNFDQDTNFFFRRLQLFDSIGREDMENLEDWRLWQFESTIDIKEFTNIVELQLGVWTYTGGAHGNGYLEYFLVDRTNGKELFLKDFINDLTTFNVIAEKHFRSDNEIGVEDNLSELGFWFENDQFSCNENFYFTEEAMHFVYNNYEIAPYSAGQIEFSIPISEINEFLKIQL